MPITNKRDHTKNLVIQAQDTLCYLLHSHPHPSGIRFFVKDSQKRIIFDIIRQASPPPRYYFMKAKAKTTLTIKIDDIGTTRLYRLFKEKSELFSLKRIISSTKCILRNEQRKPIAWFIPLNSRIVHLRTSIHTIARLKFKTYPAPIQIHISNARHTSEEWLLATILYIVAKSEDEIPRPPHPGDLKALQEVNTSIS